MEGKYFDHRENRLVYINQKATPEYWDKLWDNHILTNLYKIKYSRWNFIIRKSRKYLPINAKIMEGGCGTGIQVLKLHKAGFDVTGLDYSPRTITHLTQEYPELTFTLGDVRNLPMEDNSFDGYWSFGVIEHFYQGYREIVKEMHRVLKPGKYLFLAFPHMSRCRKRKAQKGRYPAWNSGEKEIEHFYQFALDEKKVKSSVEEAGFQFVEQKKLSGQSGVLDEGGFFAPLMNVLYYKIPGFLKPLRTIANLLLTPYYSNSILLIFRKNDG